MDEIHAKSRPRPLQGHFGEPHHQTGPCPLCRHPNFEFVDGHIKKRMDFEAVSDYLSDAMIR